MPALPTTLSKAGRKVCIMSALDTTVSYLKYGFNRFIRG